MAEGTPYEFDQLGFLVVGNPDHAPDQGTDPFIVVDVYALGLVTPKPNTGSDLIAALRRERYPISHAAADEIETLRDQRDTYYECLEWIATTNFGAAENGFTKREHDLAFSLRAIQSDAKEALDKAKPRTAAETGAVGTPEGVNP
jgi:hypothetical protein